jgi:uncharacterized protein (UPF0303 family)
MTLSATWGLDEKDYVAKGRAILSKFKIAGIFAVISVYA